MPGRCFGTQTNVWNALGQPETVQILVGKLRPAVSVSSFFFFFSLPVEEESCLDLWYSWNGTWEFCFLLFYNFYWCFSFKALFIIPVLLFLSSKDLWYNGNGTWKFCLLLFSDFCWSFFYSFVSYPCSSISVLLKGFSRRAQCGACSQCAQLVLMVENV